jgi:site-specific recombinase XerD
MPDPTTTPSFSTLLQRFFVEHLGRHRAVSPCTIAAYRDTFRLLLSFAEAKIGKAPIALALVDVDTRLILSFLDHLEKERRNSVRSRNARLAALRSFLKYAAHHDLTALPVIEQALAIPMKRFDRRVLGFLSRQEIQTILEAPDPRTWAGQRDRALFSLMYNTGGRMARSNVTQRLELLAVLAAAKRHPQLSRRSISPHTIRHTTAMHLLQSGVDVTVIALWLGHESPATTHMYLEADLSMKERTLNRLQPLGASLGRYRPPDQLMQFLQSL